MKNVRFVCCLVLLLGQVMVFGQDFSNKGKEFWIAYPAHIDGTTSVMGLYITSNTNTTGTVQLGNKPAMSFTVVANEVTRIFLNATGTGTVTGTTPIYFGLNTDVYLNMADGVKPGSAIKITTTDPVVVYSHIIRSARSGATLVLPTQVLGNEYIAPSMNSTSTSRETSDGTVGGVSEIVVIATQNNTIVEITPTANGRSGRKAGASFQVTLDNAGDCYQFQSVTLGDLSGTKISSKSAGSSGCKPVAVFSATTWSAFDCAFSSGGDNLYQQLFPTRSWGKKYVTAPFINRPNDLFRIYVQNSTTTVDILENGITTTLNATSYNSAGKFYTYRSSNPIVITGSEPVSVAQYITSQTCKTGCSNGGSIASCYSDPEMVLLNPVEQTLQDITFFSAHSAYVPAGQTLISLHFVNIIISKQFKNSLKIDNAAPKGTFVDIPGSNYSYLQEDITTSSEFNPIHRVIADTSFTAIVYGYGNVESYGYNGGTNVRDFSPSTTFQNPYNRIDSAVTCINTPLQFSVPLSYLPTSIKWDFSAAPNISPNTAITGSTTYDSIGMVNKYHYYGTGITYSFKQANTAALRDTIKLYTTSSTPDGCGSTDQLYAIPVTVRELPIAKFIATAGGCITDTVSFINQSTVGRGIITRGLWDFGDGTTADSVNVPSKVYNSTSPFTIKLKAVSDIGCVSGEVNQTIQQSAKPIANFTGSAIRCINNDILFTDASTTPSGTIAKWIWDLGDGAGPITNTTNAAVSAKYDTDGTKAVSLQVASATGCRSETYQPLFSINPQPLVKFGLPKVCLSDAFAFFTDSSTIADGSQAQFKWAWNFNAGSPAVTPGPNLLTSTLQNPQIEYAKADNYKVSLTVTSKDGCIANTIQDFTVNGSIPKAAFAITNATPYCGAKPVLLQNNSTVDFGSVTRLDIYWDFANNPTLKETDETPTPGKIYPHSYPDLSLPGAKQYTIKLVAYSGNSGTACVDFITRNIDVYPQPKAAFSVSSSQLCFGDMVRFLDKSNGVSSAATTWAWNLGRGDLSSLQNPTKQYNDSGLINVSLYFYNADGCISDTASQLLTVYPNPVLSLTHQIRVLEGGMVTIMPELVYGSELQYLWTPATYLNSDTAAMPRAIPLNDITYRLTLTGRGGCSVSDTIFVKVLKGPEVPNAFSPNGDGIHDTWKIKYLEGYPGATIDVYNRYGQIVFRSLGYDVAWNGSYLGKPLPVGTYYYIINPKNGRQIITGSVTIIK